MSAKAKKAREQRPASGLGSPVHEGGLRLNGGTNHAGATPATGLQSDTFTPVTLPDGSILPARINTFEVGNIFNGDVNHAYFNEYRIDHQIKLLRYLDKVCRNLDPNWKNREWDENTHLFDLFGAMVQKINLWAVEHGHNLHFAKVMGFTRRDLKKEESLPKYYLEIQSDCQCLTEFCYMGFLPELDEVDPVLAKIILTVIAKMSARYGISVWYPASGFIIEHLKDMLDQGEVEDQDDMIEAIKDWNKGDPHKWHLKARKLVKASEAGLRKAVKAYKWNTPFKRRLLVWLRMTDKICRNVEPRDIGIYRSRLSTHDEVMSPQDFMGFRWEPGSSNLIEAQWEEWYQTSWENSELMPYCIESDISKPGFLTDFSNDPLPKWLDSWMCWACYLFDDEFMRRYNNKGRKKKKKK